MPSESLPSLLAFPDGIEVKMPDPTVRLPGLSGSQHVTSGHFEHASAIEFDGNFSPQSVQLSVIFVILWPIDETCRLIDNTIEPVE